MMRDFSLTSCLMHKKYFKKEKEDRKQKFKDSVNGLQHRSQKAKMSWKDTYNNLC